MKRVALVTGANRGIGKEICIGLCRLGYTVILTSRNKKIGNDTFKKLKYKSQFDIYYHQLDVNSITQILNLRKYILRNFERIDVVINNAGVLLERKKDGSFKNIFETKFNIFQRTFETNVIGPLRIILEFFPIMKKQQYGRIVNVSSGMGRYFEFDIDAAYYRLSKNTLNSLTKLLSTEGKRHNILINSVCPGWVRTRMGTSKANRRVEDAAENIIWAATLPDNGPNGMLLRDKKLLSG